MTDGTSQGLFIVVAIVIFGIFTLMAYILFEDTLSPALASMFKDAIENTNSTVARARNTVENPKLHTLRVNILNDDYAETGVYRLEWDGTDSSIWGGTLPSGLHLNQDVKLKWGETIHVSFDILSTVDTIAGVDLNAKSLTNPSNDLYGSHSSEDFLHLFKDVKANKKETITYSISNDNEERNPNHHDIYEFSTIGIQTNLLKGHSTFEISNFSYYITD